MIVIYTQFNDKTNREECIYGIELPSGRRVGLPSKHPDDIDADWSNFFQQWVFW